MPPESPPPDRSPVPTGSFEPGVLEEEVQWLRGLVGGLVPDEPTADDVVQDLMGAAVARRGAIGDLRAFLAGAARRRVAMLFRDRARREERERTHAEERARETEGADEAAARVEWMRVVLEELQALPRAQREALTLTHVEGLSPAEIARRSEVAPSTVRGHLARGREALRERLDRRCGGRGSWMALALPLVSRPLPPLEPAVHAAAATPAATLATLSALTMSAKPALVAILPLAALGFLWFQRPADLDQPVREQARAGAEGTEVDGLPGGELTASDPERSALESEPAASAPAVASAAGPRVDVLVVDVLTGEPVPDLQVVVPAAVALPEGHVPLDRPGLARENGALELVTDRSGRLSSEGAEGAEGLDDVDQVYLEVMEEGRWRANAERLGPFDLPLRGQVEVKVGPTFELVSAVAPSCGWEALSARILDQNGRRSWRLGARVRTSPRPWVRLPFAVTALEDGASWPIELVDEEELCVGTATVTRTRGIDPVAVSVAFEELGGIEFLAPFAPGGLQPIGAVEVRAASAPEEVIHAYLDPPQRRSGEGATRSKARVGRLAPGAYSWRRGTRSGGVTVAAGSLVRVDLPEVASDDAMHVTVELDATALPEADLSSAGFRVMKAGSLFHGFNVSPRRSPSLGEGRWRLELDGLPAGRWSIYAPEGRTGMRWEPEVAEVIPGEPAPRFTARPLGQTGPIAVEVVDAATGELIPGAEVALNTGGLMYMILPDQKDEPVISTDVPMDATVHLLVGAPGYRIRGERFTPAEDGTRRRVELEVGWGAVVRVMESTGSRWLEGVEVHVDGTTAGRTDTNGEVWIEGDGPPTSIELAGLPEGYQVLRAPELGSTDASGSSAPLFGYLFVVTGG